MVLVDSCWWGWDILRVLVFTEGAMIQLSSCYFKILRSNEMCWVRTTGARSMVQVVGIYDVYSNADVRENAGRMEASITSLSS